MRYGMRSIQKKPILSHLIGALLGAMSVLKYSVPVVFVGASLIFGVRQWSIWSAKSASGVILFWSQHSHLIFIMTDLSLFATGQLTRL